MENLGVYSVRFMLFDVHINEKSKKATCILVYISRTGDSLDKQTRVIVVQTLVLSLIDYCISIQGNEWYGNF